MLNALLLLSPAEEPKSLKHAQKPCAKYCAKPRHVEAADPTEIVLSSGKLVHREQAIIIFTYLCNTDFM